MNNDISVVVGMLPVLLSWVMSITGTIIWGGLCTFVSYWILEYLFPQYFNKGNQNASPVVVTLIVALVIACYIIAKLLYIMPRITYLG